MNPLVDFKKNILSIHSALNSISTNIGRVSSIDSVNSLSNFILFDLDSSFNFLSQCFISKDDFFKLFIRNEIVPHLDDLSTPKFDELIQFSSSLSEDDLTSFTNIFCDITDYELYSQSLPSVITTRVELSPQFTSLLIQYISLILDFGLLVFKI